MPNRILREGILTSDRVNALSSGAENFYRRLMSVVDDYGRYTANPTLLRAACFPLRVDQVKESHIEAWLKECVQGGESSLLEMYTVEGKVYLRMRDFGQRTRTPSKFPDPPVVESAPHNDRELRASREHSAAHARGRSESESYSESEAYSKADDAAAPPRPVAVPGGRGMAPHPIHDYQWAEFKATAEEAGVSGSAVDWQEAFTFEWKNLDQDQKIAAVNGLRVQRAPDDPVLKALPVNYLKKRMWDRRIRGPDNSQVKTPTSTERMAERLKQRAIEREALLGRSESSEVRE